MEAMACCGMAEDDFIFVEEGHTFDLGGVTAEVVEIPGHTPGSIGLLVKEKRLFLASDGVNANTWLFLPESQKLSFYQETLKKYRSGTLIICSQGTL